MALISQQQYQQKVASLRHYLSLPVHRIYTSESAAKHQAALANIWEYSLALTDNNVDLALKVCAEATKSGPQADENLDITKYWKRLHGIPSRAFGDEKGYSGVDKVQHFFGSALLGYRLSLSTMRYNPLRNKWSPANPMSGEFESKLIGVAWEVKDWIKALFGSESGGYSKGDIHADDRGAEFGGRLAQFVTVPGEKDPTAGSKIDSFVRPPDKPTKSTVDLGELKGHSISDVNSPRTEFTHGEEMSKWQRDLPNNLKAVADHLGPFGEDQTGRSIETPQGPQTQVTQHEPKTQGFSWKDPLAQDTPLSRHLRGHSIDGAQGPQTLVLNPGELPPGEGYTLSGEEANTEKDFGVQGYSLPSAEGPQTYVTSQGKAPYWGHDEFTGDEGLEPLRPEIDSQAQQSFAEKWQQHLQELRSQHKFQQEELLEEHMQKLYTNIPQPFDPNASVETQTQASEVLEQLRESQQELLEEQRQQQLDTLQQQKLQQQELQQEWLEQQHQKT